MEQRNLGNTGLTCSALGFVTWEMSTTQYGQIDVAEEGIAVNAALDSAPETLNTSPYDGGWMLRLKLANPADANALLDAAAYGKLTG